MAIEELKELLTDIDDTKNLNKQGVLFIDGEFDTDLANRFRIQYLNCVRSGITNIIIFINSYGGNVHDFLSIYGLIKSTPHVKIETIINGYAMSAGAYLALLGDRRRATEGSRIMFHELSSYSNGKLNEMALDLKESKILQKLLTDIIKNNTVVEQYYYIDQWLEKDQTMGVNEAYKLGVLTNKKCVFEIVEQEDDRK